MTPEQELDLRMAEPEQGEVVRFKVAYPYGPRTYNYVSLNVGGTWYLTGTEVTGRSWDDLITWLKNKNAEILSMSRATSWEDIL